MAEEVMMAVPQWPSVDVIIATHNRPQLVRQAIEGVRSQSYDGRLRCLIVFDQSDPDETLEVHEGDRPVEVLRNVRTRGLAGARNSGVLHSDAEMVAFCDDDDVWLPSKLKRQIADMQRTGALTSVTGIVVAYKDKEVVRLPSASEMTVTNLARTRVMAAHPSSVVVRRQSMIDDIGLVDEDIPGSYGEDFDWILRAAGSGEISVVEAPLVRVLWGQSQFSQKWPTIIEAIDYQCAKHEIFETDRRARARERSRRSFALAAVGRRREAVKDAATAIGSAPQELRSYLAIAVALRLVSAQRLMDVAHKRGRGI